jgi:hypothetical protein
MRVAAGPGGRVEPLDHLARIVEVGSENDVAPLVDLCDDRGATEAGSNAANRQPGSVVGEVEALALELAGCLRRFLDVTADDHTLARAEQALAAWDSRRAARASATNDSTGFGDTVAMTSRRLTGSDPAHRPHPERVARVAALKGEAGRIRCG